MLFKIAFQIDPIEKLNFSRDSSLLIALSAYKHGHEIYFYYPQDMYFKESNIYSKSYKVSFTNNNVNSIKLHEQNIINLNDMKAIFVRQDPPFNMEYITSTYLLSRLNKEVIILNNPKALREFPEKFFPLNFPEFCPPTLITNNLLQIKNFLELNQEIVLKPLYGYGGTDVFLIKQDSLNLNSIFSLLKDKYNEPIIAQKFLPQVKNGDKRIMLLNGKPVGQVLRVPDRDEFRSNLGVGGKGLAVDLSENDLAICKAISDSLIKNGIFLAGIDIIGNYLTEINITSPTGIAIIKEVSGVDIAEKIIDELEIKLSS